MQPKEAMSSKKEISNAVPFLPGDSMYVIALKELMSSKRLSLEEAAKLYKEQIDATEGSSGEEHLEPFYEAVDRIRLQQQEKQI